MARGRCPYTLLGPEHTCAAKQRISSSSSSLDVQAEGAPWLDTSVSVSAVGHGAPLYIIVNRMAYGKQYGDTRHFHAHPPAEGISAMPRWGRARGVVKQFTAAMASRRDLGRTKAKFNVIILDLMRRRARRSARSLLRPTEPSSRVSAALVRLTGLGARVSLSGCCIVMRVIRMVALAGVSVLVLLVQSGGLASAELQGRRQLAGFVNPSSMPYERTHRSQR